MDFTDLPRGIPDSHASQDKAPRALWVARDKIKSHPDWQYSSDKIFLGGIGGVPIGVKDNRHLLTIAGSRTGKGTSAIVPNLLMYQGSVLVIDPKGENATLTAERRGRGEGIKDGGLDQDVFVIDPFGVADVDDSYRAGFNPLSSLNSLSENFIDDCDAIADALVVQDKTGANSHFYDTARLVLRGYIAWVVAHPEIKNKTLNEVKRLIFLPKIPAQSPEDRKNVATPEESDPVQFFEQLNIHMMRDKHFAYGVPYEAASTLISMGIRVIQEGRLGCLHHKSF
ncbi:type IV secretory system conjugative DNA transfer family protein [Pacificibacter sp. AS14]|uniref:type IV secretory system conjugative DNA transfer family protein n=1 Tax=Pacificibacter sp. AS14 TaxID=3135785 RepID=UPI003182A6B0